jgi:CheY-like chemotaxis protein
MIPCKILIVDDDHDDIDILREALEGSGVEAVHHVHTAMQAFLYLQEFKLRKDLPKLIVVDSHLQGITGAEFLADLKTMELYKEIHIIVMSTTKSDKEIERYRQIGVVEYLVKPSSYDEYKKVAAEIKSKLEQ